MATGATPVASIGVALGASVGNHRYERKPLGQLAQLEVRVLGSTWENKAMQQARQVGVRVLD